MAKVYADLIEKGELTVEELLAKKIPQSMKDKVLAELDKRGYKYEV